MTQPSSKQRPTTIKDKERFSSANKRWMLLLRGAVDKLIVWVTGYSLMTAQYMVAAGEPYRDTLYLKTVGARSGQLRSACPPYFEVDGHFVIRGSNGGGPTDPAWVHNIRAHDCAWIRVKRKTMPVSAYVASGDERERLFTLLSQQSPSTKAYQKMCAPRELPLVGCLKGENDV